MIEVNKLPLTFCRLLQKIQQQQKIPIGQFSSKTNKALLKEFIDEGVFQSISQRGTKYIFCKSIENLNNTLKIKGIRNLTEYIGFLNKKETTRAEAAQISSNSKHKKGRIFNGFFVKSYLPTYGKIFNQPICLQPIRGSWIYIADFKGFTIEEDITIVGIENTETFTLIDNYKHLFKEIKPLFLLRYNNNSYIEWLQNISNNYLHFGDFDLSGIAIYISNFRKKMGENRCNYFIPSNIDILIKNSKNREDYLKQLNDNTVKGIDFEQYPEVLNLVKLIHKEKKTLEQEALMILVIK